MTIRNLGLENADIRKSGNGFNVVTGAWSVMAGGFIGFARGSADVTIENCYVYGHIESFYRINDIFNGNDNYAIAGGFIGEWRSSGSLTIRDSYARGRVEARSQGNGTSIANAGGLIGRIPSTGGSRTITNCYTANNIRSHNNSNDLPASRHFSGSLIGWEPANRPLPVSSYRSRAFSLNGGTNGENGGSSQSAAATFRTEEAMTTGNLASTYVNWNFISVWERRITENNDKGYPSLRMFNSPEIGTHGQLAGETVGVSYSNQLEASGGISPIRWEIKNGTLGNDGFWTGGGLPPGIRLSRENGALVGTPTAAGTFRFDVIAIGGGGRRSEEKRFSITISPANAPATRLVALDVPQTMIEVARGYTSQRSFTITVNNIGTHSSGTGALTIHISDTDKFDLSHDSITNIPRTTGNNSFNFTVTPKTGLGLGEHPVTVTVSGANLSSNPDAVTLTFNVRELVARTDLSYDFNNDARDLYPEFMVNNNSYNTYRIPLERAQLMYGRNVAADWVYNIWKYIWDNDDNGFAGNCLGMSMTSTIFNQYDQSGGVNVNSFFDPTTGVRRRSIGELSPANPIDRSNAVDLSLREFIEAMQIAQFDARIQRELHRNHDNLDGLYDAVENFQNTGQNPVIIYVYKNAVEAHCIVPYKVQDNRIYVYDPNCPNCRHKCISCVEYNPSCTNCGCCVIELDGTRGAFARWFPYGKIDEWKTTIRYIEFTHILNLWRERGSLGNLSLINSVLLFINDGGLVDILITASNGNTASVAGGILENSNINNAFQASIAGGAGGATVLYLPVGNYNFTGTNNQPVSAAMSAVDSSISIEAPARASVNMFVSDNNNANTATIEFADTSSNDFEVTHMYTVAEDIISVTLSGSASQSVDTRNTSSNEIILSGADIITIEMETGDNYVQVENIDLSDYAAINIKKANAENTASVAGVASLANQKWNRFIVVTGDKDGHNSFDDIITILPLVDIVGIDYSADDIIALGSEENFEINLTKETISLGYEVKAFSIDGGNKWRAVKADTFSAARFPRLLNKDMTLWLSDMELDKKAKGEMKNKPLEGATIVTFATIKKRPNAPRVGVNYSIGADATGVTTGDWLLVSREKGADATKAFKDGIQIAAADGKVPDSRGYGRFFEGDTTGIAVRPLSGDRVSRTVYLVRTEPRFDGTEYTAAGKPRRITVAGEQRATRHRIEYRNEVIRLRQGDTYSFGTRSIMGLSGVSTERSMEVDLASSIAGGTAINIRRAATERRPATAVQVITPESRASLTTDGVTVVNGRLSLDKKYEVFNPATNKWGNVPRVTADAEFDIRLKSTARQSKGVWSGNAASATGRLRITWGVHDTARNRSGIVAAEIVF
jgi:hypothetical protein